MMASGMWAQRCLRFYLSLGVLVGVASTVGCALHWSSPSPIVVNELGYLRGADKVVVVVSDSEVGHRWTLTNPQTEEVELTGSTDVFGVDPASNDHLHRIDLSEFDRMGPYDLRVEDLDASATVRIGAALYERLPEDAMAYFYFHRLGVPIDAQYLHYPRHARSAIHPPGGSIAAFDDWTDHRFNVRFGWADAGDFGVYPVNHAVAAWTLANLYERYEAFGDGTLALPERTNGRPDILDELLFGSAFLAGMLPAQGLAAHKVHGVRWSGFPTTVEGENAIELRVMRPSTNSTLAIARTYAHLARIVRPSNAAKAAELLSRAEEAYGRASVAPDVDYTSEDDGGGSYADTGNEDDRYAAAVELYLTTKRAVYRADVTGSKYYGAVQRFGWKNVAATGTLSLLSVGNDLPPADLAAMKARVISRADRLTDRIRRHGYPTPLGVDDYVWGSNAVVLNEAIFIAYAYEFTGDVDYLKAVYRAMDHLMGVNALRMSFVTGYGTHRERDLHDRWAWSAYQRGIPFPPGWVAGGPNDRLVNDKATPRGVAPAKSYADANTAPRAWCSKENAINWNAPLVWVSWFLRHHQGRLSTTGPGRP